MFSFVREELDGVVGDNYGCAASGEGGRAGWDRGYEEEHAAGVGGFVCCGGI